jgi:tetratricopeptide (TPR) repeat protein
MRESDWPVEDIYRIAERGYSLHMQGRYAEAAVIFDGLVSADPENVYCRDALAAAWLALGEPQLAIGQLSAILSAIPGHVGARARRAEAYLQLHNLTAARSDLDFLKRLLPENEIRRLELAMESAARDATLSRTLR